MQTASLKTTAAADAPSESALDPRGAAAPTPRLGPERFHLECVTAAGLADHRAAWTDLAGRALEANVFLEPGFALPLLHPLATWSKLRFLLVWETGGPGSVGGLLGLFPLMRPRGALAFAGIARGLVHNQVCSGVPLVDRDRAVDVLDAAITWIGGAGGRAGVLVLEQVPEGGAFFTALCRLCVDSGRGLSTLDAYERAVLRHGGPSDAPLSAKRRKEQARLFRRLSDMGQRAYTSARTPDEVAAAAERFVALEHRGWKGRNGTSFLSAPASARFLRDLTQDLSLDAKCRIDATEIDGKPVAMGIVLSTGDRAYYWKTAFDEAFAALSPGVQFTMELTQAQTADPLIVSTDSCAIADHPMIDRLWPDRHTILHLMVETRPASRWRFKLGGGVERLRRYGRQRAKDALAGVRRFGARCKAR